VLNIGVMILYERQPAAVLDVLQSTTEPTESRFDLPRETSPVPMLVLTGVDQKKGPGRPPPPPARPGRASARVVQPALEGLLLNVKPPALCIMTRSQPSSARPFGHQPQATSK
jgi:hypothetical protein